MSGTCPSLTFKLNGYTVTTTSATEFSKGPCKDLKDGKGLWLRGELTSPSTVTALRIEFDR